MAIQIIDGFQVNTALPIDNRIVASGSSARNAIPYKYEGLRVFDTSDSVPYVWINGAWQSENASGISGAGTTNYLPVYTSSNVIGNSLLYQSGVLVKTVNTGSGADKVTINAGTGLVTAAFSGNGSLITDINASNISTGALALNRLTNGSTGWILTGGVTSPTYVNPNQVTVGTASVSSNSAITQTTTNAAHYLTFVSTGSWQSTTGNATIRANGGANTISYNPFTNILSTGRINYSGGSLPSTSASRLTLLNLTSTTTNTSNLEVNSIRVSTGTDWLTSGYRIQCKVDAEYMGYIQFNGNNETGISFGTGYMSTDGTSNNRERMRIDISGRVIIGTSSVITTNSILNLSSNSTLVDGAVHRAFNNSNNIFEFKNAAGTTRGQIIGSGASSVAYQTSSDRRLKTNIQEMPSMYDKIKNLKPSKFNWKIDNKEDYGFIAQEVYSLIPSLRVEISESYCDVNSDNFDIENPVKRDGTDFNYSLDYGKLTPYLTKALQETMEKLETLTDKIKSANTLEDLKSSL
jgi:hypothetical protein